MVQKSAMGFDVAPAPRAPGTPKRPFTAMTVRAPAWCALIVAAVAAPPPPTINTSVSYLFMPHLDFRSASAARTSPVDCGRELPAAGLPSLGAAAGNIKTRAGPPMAVAPEGTSKITNEWRGLTAEPPIVPEPRILRRPR